MYWAKHQDEWQPERTETGQDSASEADDEEEEVEGDTGLVSARLSDVTDVDASGDEADS